MAARFEDLAARWKWRFCTRERDHLPLFFATSPLVLLDIRAASLPMREEAAAPRSVTCRVLMSLEINVRINILVLFAKIIAIKSQKKLRHLSN